MNGPEFVITIIVITFVFVLLRQRMNVRHRWERPENDERESAENVRLRQHVDKLQDRIRVLERIVTDRGVETAAQIEAPLGKSWIDAAQVILDAFADWVKHSKSVIVTARSRTLHLQVADQASQILLVQASTNLHDWTVIGIVNNAGADWIKFEDAQASRFPERYYRVVSP